MAIVAANNQDGVLRAISDLPPTHYTVKIESFSLLSKNNIEKYYSGKFEAGGYRWKLAIYPNGKIGKEHLAVYLAMAEPTSLRPGWEVFATFKLFLLDQNNDKYLTVEASGNGRLFHGMKLESGFDQFIHHRALNDTVNGYLVDDTCVLGAEVFISKETSKGKLECLSLIEDAITHKYTWKVEDFSELDQACCESETFNRGGHKWKIQMHPNGDGNGTGSHISLYLALADVASISHGSKVLAEFTIRILDRVNDRHLSNKATHWFSDASPKGGWSTYITLNYLHLARKRFISYDTCWVETEITIHGVTNVV